MKLLALYDNTAGTAHIRMLVPCRYLEKLGWEIVLAPITDDALREKNDEDICVMLKNFLPNGLHMVLMKRAAGIPVVVSVDDDYHCLPKHNAVYRTFGLPVVEEMERKMRESGELLPGHQLVRPTTTLADLYRMVDAIDVPTYALANVLKKYNKNVTVLPNCIDGGIVDPWPAPPKFLGTLRILWTGSTSHERDMVPVNRALRRLLKEHAHVKFIMIGPLTSAIEGLPEKQVEFYPGIPEVDGYHRLLCYTPAHLGLAPLEFTTFNRSKSPLKAYEYAEAGVLPVLQDFVPYRDIPELGKLVPSVPKCTEESWYKALKPFCEDPSGIEARAKAWQDTVWQKHTMGPNVHRWDAFYKKVIAGPRSTYKPDRFLNIPTSIKKVSGEEYECLVEKK